MSEQCNQSVEQMYACLQPSAGSSASSSVFTAVNSEPNVFDSPPAPKVEQLEPASLVDACKKIIHDIEKKSENIMQAVCDAEYKGSLPAPHTLLELKQSLERNEFKSYSEFLKSLDHVWENVKCYFPSHTSLHKAAADMKELSLKLVSDHSGQSPSQLYAESHVTASHAPSTAPQSAHGMLPTTSLQDMPSLTQVSALGSSADFSMFMSMFPGNSFPYPNPDLFSFLLSQHDFSLFPSQVAPVPPASMGENALNILHGAGGYDPAIFNQFFNAVSMFPAALQTAAEPVATAAPRPVHQAHPKFDPMDLGPAPVGKNPLIDVESSKHIHLDMVGITATVNFRCQFNIDALRNYADRNEKKFVPSSDQKKSVENSVNFRISVPGGQMTTQVAGVLFVNGICKVSFARSDLSQLFDEIQHHIFTIDTDAQKAGHRVIQDPNVEWVAQDQVDTLSWRRWSTINYCLIKKQFHVGFKVKYVEALELLRPLEKDGFVWDLRPAQSSGSGLFFRLRLRGKIDPVDGEISATVYHSGMVQVNGSKGCTEEHLQIACNGFCHYFQINRAAIEPPDDDHADGNKRKKRAVAPADNPSALSGTPGAAP